MRSTHIDVEASDARHLHDAWERRHPVHHPAVPRGQYTRAREPWLSRSGQETSLMRAFKRYRWARTASRTLYSRTRCWLDGCGSWKSSVSVDVDKSSLGWLK